MKKISFSQEELPPIFEYIIQKINENGGTITSEDFRKILVSIRVTKNDVKTIKDWLQQNGYITIKHEKRLGVIHLQKDEMFQ